MKRLYSRLAITVAVLTALMAGSAWCATVSGTLTKPGVTKTGRIYLQMVDNNSGGSVSYGTSVATSATGFTIQGVKSGDYQLFAFMDVQGYGVRHTMDPAYPTDINASSGITVNVPSDGDIINVGTVSLATPANINPVQLTAPQIHVIVGNGGNLLGWDGTLTNDYYNITSYTNATCTTGAVVHSSIPSGGNDMWAHAGGSSTSSYKIESVNVKGDGTVIKSALSPCVSGTAPTGGITATGKVSFSGITTTGPLFVALMDDANHRYFVTAVSTPVSPQTYTINNVAPGNYSLGMFLDPGNKGIIGSGNISWSNNGKADVLVTVGAGAVTLPELTITSQNADIGLTTQHGYSDPGNEWYNIQIMASDAVKHPVTIKLTDGPNLALKPVDLGLGRNWPEFDFWQNVTWPNVPAVGDTYSFTVGFSDGSTENLTRAVTGVITTFPTPTFPPANGTVSSTFPLFAWSMPGLIPGIFIFKPQMQNMDGGDSPKYPPFVNTMANSYSLSQPNSYYWNALVSDSYKNEGYYSAQFTTTTGGPAISSFAPATGPAGTPVTIIGTGFSTTPANNTVKFNGVAAAVNTATATSLGVTVPANAPAGPVSITVGSITAVSPGSFAATISFTDTVKNSGGSPISGVTAVRTDTTTPTVTTDGNGNFTYTSFPSMIPTILKMTKSGYADTYSALMLLNASANFTNTPAYFTMLSAAEYAGLNVTAGKGAIVALVTAPNLVPLAGATVTATSSLHRNEAPPVAAAPTSAQGTAMLKSAFEGDTLSLTATLPGWTFGSTTVVTHSGALSEALVIGSPIPPTIDSVSPPYGAPGNTITINGTNFDPTPANNTVMFGTTVANVLSASTTQLTVTIPNIAYGSYTISVALASNNQTATYPGFSVAVQTHYSLTIVRAGAGSGSGLIEGISYGSIPFSVQGTAGVPANITISPDANSVFRGWSSPCSGAGSCQAPMNNNFTVTATLDLKPVFVPLYNFYFLSLQEGYNFAPDNSSGTVHARAVTNSDFGITMNRNIVTTVHGGFDETYTAQSGTTTIQGPFSITNGGITIDHALILGTTSISGTGVLTPAGLTIR